MLVNFSNYFLNYFRIGEKNGRILVSPLVDISYYLRFPRTSVFYFCRDGDTKPCKPRMRDTHLAEGPRFIDVFQGAKYLVRSKFARF